MTANPADDLDGWGELYDADLPRVDLVHKGANGMPFLIAKQDGDSRGLVPPDMVRDLIGKEAGPQPAQRGERITLPSGITVSGSPADIAAFIHKAAERKRDADDVAKAEMSTKSINDLPDSAFAFIEPGGKKDADGKTTPRKLRHFPVQDAAHTRDALSRAPQSPYGDKAMPKIRAAAKRFGIEVSKEAPVAQVAKDAMDTDEGMDGLDPTVPLGPEPDGGYPGSATDPGSPAWEALDASTACKWTSILARARVAIDLLAEREMLEAASGDDDDAGKACDLQDVCCAIDFAIGVLAPFAVSEQSAADCGAAELEAVGKAMAGFDPAPLGVVEGFAAVAKSGRVLSAANEAHIREAAQRLQTVLASLPRAPVSDDGQPVAKEKGTPVSATATETQTADETPVEKEAASAAPDAQGGETAPESPQQASPAALVAKAADGLQVAVYDRAGALCLVTPSAIRTSIAKADGDSEGKPAMQAVFDENGDLIGICDPADITPVSGTGKKPAPEPEGDGEAAAPADPGDMTPAPAAETGTPADAVEDGTVTKSSTQDTDVLTVLKSIVAEAVSSALGAQAPQEDIAKQADVAGLSHKVEELLGRVAKVEEMPAAPKVFTNGQVPPREQMRGQDKGAAAVNVAKAAELRRRFREADPAEQNQLASEMQQAAIGHLNALHGRA